MILRAKVKPNSKKEAIEKISNNEYKIELKEPPENNKANKRLINLLSKEFKVPTKNIKIKTPLSKSPCVYLGLKAEVCLGLLDTSNFPLWESCCTENCRI